MTSNGGLRRQRRVNERRTRRTLPPTRAVVHRRFGWTARRIVSSAVDEQDSAGPDREVLVSPHQRDEKKRRPIHEMIDRIHRNHM